MTISCDDLLCSRCSETLDLDDIFNFVDICSSCNDIEDRARNRIELEVKPLHMRLTRARSNHLSPMRNNNG